VSNIKQFDLDGEVSILGVDASVVLGPLAGGLWAAVASHSDGEVVSLKGLHIVHVVARRLSCKILISLSLNWMIFPCLFFNLLFISQVVSFPVM